MAPKLLRCVQQLARKSLDVNWNVDGRLFSFIYTSMCTCPVVQGVGHVAKCMLMCMHGSNISYYTIYIYDLLYIPVYSLLCLPSPICLPT